MFAGLFCQTFTKVEVRKQGLLSGRPSFVFFLLTFNTFYHTRKHINRVSLMLTVT